ncbi:RNA-guided endonuclease InsQ/TnpB family protein [Gloeocapsopsis dulcis]|uniref:RNA-guided endonuclease InsQ/TnpB family protein n=1 Tax=Gloeocapsopsis dulcis TaxID=2859516 RepID=UPI0018C7407B|nr:RNA-guided endonuclease TnpB family protein [Gloeocapsopsis dulcis]
MQLKDSSITVKLKYQGKKVILNSKKNNRSVEYKACGWKLSENRKYITFTDKCGIGEIKLKGTYDLHYYQLDQIKRVRIVRRADNYYIQFCIDAKRYIDTEPTGKTIGIDVGLNYFYTDSQGNQVENPRYLRKSEKALKRLQRKVSRKKKGSNNRKKACRRLGRKHLKVSRQRKDHAVKLARCVVMSNDFVAYVREACAKRIDLKIKNMVKNSKLALGIHDASWSIFINWLSYFGSVFGKVVKSVAPNYTSQDCSSCGARVRKLLSVRTHVCTCGCVLDRDENAAKNILAKVLKETGYLVNTAGSAEI